MKSKEMGLAGVKMYSFAEVWTPMLTEIRCLLSDYLMDTNQGDDGLDIFTGGSGSGHDSGSDLLRSRKANRDKNRVRELQPPPPHTYFSESRTRTFM